RRIRTRTAHRSHERIVRLSQADGDALVAPLLHGDPADLLQQLDALVQPQDRRAGAAEHPIGAREPLQARFLLAPCGDVAVGAPEAGDLPLGVHDSHGIALEPYRLTVRGAPARDRARQRAACRGQQHAGIADTRVAQQRAKILADERRRLVTQYARNRLAAETKASPGIELPDPVLRSFHGVTQALLVV